MNWGKRAASLLNFPAWPLTVRVPAVVVLLMLVVSAVISERVLTRLVETQSRHLTELTGAYLDGVSSAVLPHVLREDVWEIYDALDRATRQYNGLDVSWTTVVDDKDVIIASSQPRRHVTQETLNDRFPPPTAGKTSFSIDEQEGLSRFKRELVHQGRMVGAILGEVRIEPLIAERWSVLLTLILTNATLTIALAVIGYVMIRRMVRPVGLLSDHMRIDLGGDVRLIPNHLLGRPTSEFGRLFRRYNSLVETVRERERLLQTLAEEERLAALGRLASVMAHEINNPLGGMLNAVQTLKRHGHRGSVRESSISLVERGLIGIRNVVRSTLASHRRETDQQELTPDHLEDLAILIRPETRRKHLSLKWVNTVTAPVSLPAQPIRDAALNLLLNACAASPSNATVSFEAYQTDTSLTLRVGDDGPGLPAALSAFLQDGAQDPIPAAGHGGLGLWSVRRLATEMSGSINVEHGQDRGTIVSISIPLTPSGTPETSSAELSHVA